MTLISGYNHYGYRLIELCKNSNLCVVNGRGGDQGPANLTCKDSRTVVYFFVPDSLFRSIISFQALDTDPILSRFRYHLALHVQRM